MTENIYDFPDKATIEEEAGIWLIRLDGDKQLSHDEINRLREWLDRSPVHREQLSNLLQFYNKMNILTELSVPLGKQQVGKSAYSVKNNNQYWSPKLIFGSGAFALSIVIIILGIIVTITPGNQSNQVNNTKGLYATAVGQQNSLTLEDGSYVQLNTNSQIEVRYSQNARDVRLLQGEAYFKVEKKPKRPFRVYAGTGRVDAIGTAFAVRLKDRNVDVTVTEGRVMLVALENQVSLDTNTKKNIMSDAPLEDEYSMSLGVLDAGQSTTLRAIIINENKISQNAIEPVQTINKTELSRRLSWRDGLLIFTGDPLEEVVDEISRYSPVTIEIVDPELKAIRIGGQFRIGDIEAMLASLETNFQLRIIRLGHNHIQIATVEE